GSNRLRVLLLLFAISVPGAAASELQVEYVAIQKVLTRDMFTQDGRLYLRGAPEAKCSYAYLQDPMVGSSDGRIQIRAKFSGKSGTNLFGLCLGRGDI